MAYSNDQTLGDAIREFLKQYRLDDKLEETKLINSWEGVVGPMISKHTKDIYIRRKVLFVKLDSPALKNELSYAREKITRNLNEAAGKDVIEDVRFL